MKEVLPEKINITCTDNDQVKEAYLSRFIDGDHMEVIVNTVKMIKVRLTKNIIKDIRLKIIQGIKENSNYKNNNYGNNRSSRICKNKRQKNHK